MLRVQELCKQRGLTMQELAKRMDVTYQALYASVSGNPTIGKLSEIAKILDVDITDLFEKPADVSNTFTCPHCGKRLKLSKEE